MITDKLLEFVLRVYDFIFSKIPTVSLNIPDSVLDVVFDVLDCVLYFFPIPLLYPIFALIWALWGFRVSIRLIRTIWDLLPLL